MAQIFYTPHTRPRSSVCFKPSNARLLSSLRNLELFAEAIRRHREGQDDAKH